MNRLVSFILLISSYGLVSCEKEVVPPISQLEIYTCYQQSEWDSLKVTTALLGEWNWEFEECSVVGSDSYSRYKELRLAFKSNGELEVYQEGRLQGSHQWQLVQKDGNLFGLEVIPAVKQVYGRILFCGDRVEFNDSYIDGCDNYFRRQK